MAIEGIQSVLQQMQASAVQAAGDQTQARSASVGDFSGQLKLALDKISDIQHTAKTQSQDFEMGKPGVALNDVMVNMQKSSIAMQMGIQVRNKLVSAYSDIMNMQV
ncbi:flagellar hook-basal body complex protein FliE [Erwinia sp. OLTSP20]|uniref:flagellar hook-basal body complex protein FliE n=1 Tax=unclassified Erwinia TaxID=2622719 RepID=UPI000C19FF54|nr:MULTISPECIES: flagellar hook-basal body complex protein FliE [unclassified Erwinia]PIJ48450.1 flagellar hook-basal body complex protein FliE [Erwinia sp. OAMSP11]PIJ67623.1 flagellar hook-basal body complex protein FliE [Erwinia sp. OLSSP12]PIJ78571.1 flagellar hook-basal body complex protein FliE [Erwinia sp. OLCASP19]PIJ79455.1 flagellar hook-basal body complex protein FliE [Erwinia sp. OLMTSP26]PIJ80996.1 flagellar hook-basal body complex protein FliE [Erwinia sp. OLMDSP33]